MNYYEARQVKTDDGSGSGIWHFTGFNRRPRPDGRFWPEGCTADCRHATPEEACQHYVQVQIDRGVQRHKCSWTPCQAEGCDKPAQDVLAIGGPNGRDYALCEDHATDERAIEMYRASHRGSFSITSSY